MLHEVVKAVSAIRGPVASDVNDEVALRGYKFRIVFGRSLRLQRGRMKQSGIRSRVRGCGAFWFRGLRSGFRVSPLREQRSRHGSYPRHQTQSGNEFHGMAFHGCPPIRFDVASTCSITRRVLPPRIFWISLAEYPLARSALVICGKCDASSIPNGMFAPSKSEPRPI